MIDSTDHVTGKTGLTLTITASKAGGAFASISPTVTELATGWYKLALTSSHTDTLGDLALHITSTGADATDFCDQVSARITDDLTFPATSGRSTLVAADGSVSPNWADVKSPTTTLALTGTTIATTQKVDLETIKTNPVVNAGTVTFPTTATLASTTNITAATGVDITKILGTAISTPATAGILDVNLKNIANATVSTSTAQLGVNIVNYGGSAGTFASGRPEVNVARVDGTALSTHASGMFPADMRDIAGAAVSAISAQIGVNVVQAGGTVWSAGAITAASIANDAITAAKLDATVAPEIRSIVSGQAQSGSTTQMTDMSRSEADADHWLGQMIVFTNGTLAGQARIITAFDASMDTITFSPPTTQAVDSSHTYEIWPVGDFLRPTTTMRTLDVSSTGEAGVDWANIGSPATSQTLSGTTVGTATAVTTVNGLAANVITAAAFATTAGTYHPLNIVDQGTAQAATSTTLQLRSAAAFADTELVGARILITGGTTGVGQSRLITAYTGSTDTATVDTWTTTPSGTITYKVFSDTASAGGTPPTAAAIADAVWDEDATAHQTQGTFGQAIGDPGSDSDTIWALANTNLDAAVSSRMATYTQPTGFLAATFPSGTVANTTNITAGTITTATNVTTVNGLAANVITAAATASDFGTEIATAIWTDTTAGDFTTAASIGKSIMNGVSLGTGLTIVSVSGAVGSVTGAVGSVTGSVGSIATGGIAAASFAAGAIDAAAIATDAIGSAEFSQAAADKIWDTVLASHLTAGSTGNALNAAGAAGDPWSTAIPGAYGAGTAGHRLGNVPDVVAGAAGGLFIAGSNAATTFATMTVTGATVHTGNVSMAAGLNITQSTSDTDALVITGNGTGDGIMVTSGSGATGDAIKLLAASTNGNGLSSTATGTGVGILGTGISGAGIKGTATTSGHGIQGIGVGSAKHGIQGTGGTNADGISGVGSGTGHGMQLTGGGTSGSGLKLVLGGTGKGLLVDVVSVTSTLDVAGATTFTSIATSGTVTVNAFTCTNVFTVSGATTLTGAVTASNASNNIVGIDVAKLSGDATAADNAESFFDGTGYAGTNNVIPLVTAVTTVNGLAANTITATSIASDAITDAKVASDVTIASVTGAVGSVTGLTASNLDATISSRSSQTSIDSVLANLPVAVTRNTPLDNLTFLMSLANVPVTGASVTATVSKDGGAFAAAANAVAEVSNGIYKIDLESAEMNALVVTLRFTAAGADDRLLTIITQPTD